MDERFLFFPNLSRLVSVLIAVIYHVRFILFVDHGNVQNKTIFIKVFYLIIGLGQEAMVVFQGEI